MSNFFSKRRNKWFLIVGVSVLLIIGIGFAVAMSKRQGFLDKAMVKVQNKLKQDYDINFSVDKYYFKGLTTVEFKNLLVIPQDRDTLASMETFSVSVRVLPLLIGDVEIGAIGVENGGVSFVKKDSLSNYDFLFKKRQDNSEAVKSESKGFADLAERLSKQFFAIVPDDMDLKNFNLSYSDDKFTQHIHIPMIQIDQNSL